MAGVNRSVDGILHRAWLSARRKMRLGASCGRLCTRECHNRTELPLDSRGGAALKSALCILWGKAMQGYDIKIMGRSGEVSLQATENHSSDFAAIRAAKKLCGDGDTIEVWRDAGCIYSERPRKPIALVWPVIGGKAV